MAETLIERVWAWLHATFPERQVYIRSEGRVQFFTFGSTLQATCAGLSLIFLGWVAFASVNVIFKERIISAKDHRYLQMQSTYENRVADLQLSYDELNNALVSAEDRFKATADELEAKQQNVARLLDRKQIVDSTLAGIHATPVSVRQDQAIPPANASQGMASDSISADAPSVSTADQGMAQPAPSAPLPAHPLAGSSQLNVMPQPVEPQPRTARPTRASFLDETMARFAEALFHRDRSQPIAPSPGAPALHVLAQQTERIKRLSQAETSLMVGVDRAISGRIGDLENLLQRVGVDGNSLEQQAEGAVGGPEIPVQSIQLAGVSDSGFTGAYESATAHAGELSTLLTALRHVPLTTPVHGAQFEVTSGFGARVDPFTRRVAFHPGIDFAGPWGSPVLATAPGVVVWAGGKGGYGNMVEIDHGYGFHTRYGHLSSILVRIGAKVDKGSLIGRLGSTGRSTGPHVHYEVWVANRLNDPSRFIEAGRHVFE